MGQQIVKLSPAGLAPTVFATFKVTEAPFRPHSTLINILPKWPMSVCERGEVYTSIQWPPY